MYQLIVYNITGDINNFFEGETKEECMEQFEEFYGWDRGVLERNEILHSWEVVK
ncbi:MAG: hypothetical protein K6G40_03890 [Eubacterium sp.]|nr:hypothetical protein [Eubacterium sp.]